MRRFIFILMIALLPLRGWMGEAMATEMATMNLIATQAIDTLANSDSEESMSMVDCDMHKTNTADNKADKASCTHCQACHATCLVSAVQITSFDRVRYAQPLARASQFASANIALTQKPPIL